MNANQLRLFERATQAFDERVTPIPVVFNGVEFLAGGSEAEEKAERVEGGWVRIVDAHLTISKDILPEPFPLLSRVSIRGVEFEVVKIGGRDSYDPNWSFRVERWSE